MTLLADRIKESRWKELAVLVDKLNKTKSKIITRYFWVIRGNCLYYKMDSKVYVSIKTHHCEHPHHKGENVSCNMDECPILGVYLEEIK